MKQNAFVTYFWWFLRSNTSEQLELKLEKIVGIYKQLGKVRKFTCLYIGRFYTFNYFRKHFPLFLGEGEDSYCKPIANHGDQTYVFIRIAKPKKYCPNVLIKKDGPVGPAYIGQYPKNTNFNHDWSFLQPNIQLTEDSFLRKVEIKFDSKARTEADRARLDFLEDILKTIVE